MERNENLVRLKSKTKKKTRVRNICCLIICWNLASNKLLCFITVWLSNHFIGHLQNKTTHSIWETHNITWYLSGLNLRKSTKLVLIESNVTWQQQISFSAVEFSMLCLWLLFLRRNETAEQEDSYTGGSVTAEWQAGEQAAASFQPAGSSGQDKASLFKTPPIPQRKWESSPCRLTSPHTDRQANTRIITDGRAHMYVWTTHSNTCAQTDAGSAQTYRSHPHMSL